MGILSEKEMYFKAAERAFYRNPFSDLLIVSFTTLNSDDESWKGLQLPVLLVPADGTIPGATQKEITRRRRVNLYVWGSSDTVPDQTLEELAAFTSGKVYRILVYAKKQQPDIEDLQSAPPESDPDTQGPPAGDPDPGIAPAASETAGETVPDQAEMADAAAYPGEDGAEAEKDPALGQDEVMAEEEETGAMDPAGSPQEEEIELIVDWAEETTTEDDFEKSQEIAAEAAGEEMAGAGLPGPEATAEAAKASAGYLTEEAVLKPAPVASGETPEEYPAASVDESGESAAGYGFDGFEYPEAAEETGEEAGDPGDEGLFKEDTISLETGDAEAAPDAGGGEAALPTDQEPTGDSDDELNGNYKDHGKNVIIWRFPS